MKKNILKLCVIVGTMGLLSGCFQNTLEPSSATTVPLVENSGSKTGMAKCTYILFFIYVSGDCTVEAAMLDGEITKATSVTQRVKNVLFIVGSTTTIVKGE